MCRLAALSDFNHVAALAEWVATSDLAEHEAVPDGYPCERFPLDPRGVDLPRDGLMMPVSGAQSRRLRVVPMHEHEAGVIIGRHGKRSNEGTC
jgi:hypothetical protein